jgi:ATP-binding cassette subfamily B protein
VAIVGRSARRKIDSAFAALESPRSTSRGRIFFGDVPLHSIDPHALRAAVAVVPQDMPILDRSLARQHRDVEARRKSRSTRCGDPGRYRLAEVVARLPDGLDTPLGNAARAFPAANARASSSLANCSRGRGFAFDKATSALDPNTEAAVMEALLRRTPTIFLIAHRLETVRGLRRILVFDDGRLTCGDGTHELAAACAPYRALRLLSKTTESDAS